MLDDGSRLLAIEGMVVLGVVDVGGAVELEVETVARAACCRWCGRASVTARSARWCVFAICRSRAVRWCCVGASAAIDAMRASGR